VIADSALKDPSGQESRLADSFEALLAALYLSTHTLKLIHPWLDPHLRQLVTEVRQDPARQNYKAALQEWSQAHYKTLPAYRVHESTPVTDEAQRFFASVWLHDEQLGEGYGRSIKAAEQAAAQAAFWVIHQQKSL